MCAQCRLAVSLTRADPPLAEQVAAALRARADLIELRVDRIGDADAVEALLTQPHAVPFILTVRSREEGGAWEGDEAARIALIRKLARHAPGFVDVECAAWNRLSDKAGESPGPQRDAAPALGGNTLILSHHDMGGTPRDLDGVFDRLEKSPAGVVKAAFTAEDALDSLRVLEQLHRSNGRRHIVALAMGEAGLATRVLARKFGAFLTFAALERGAESAPGQLAIRELREIYRWDAILPATPVFGIVGWPVTHSLSPRLHNALMAAAEIDGVYLPFPVKPGSDDLEAFLDYAAANPWLDLAGLSVTVPHKEHVAGWLRKRGCALGAIAERCGAVNTLVRTPDGGWRGENTDASGAILALETLPELAGGRLDGLSVDVLGAGGVASAVAAALLDRNCDVTIFNRSQRRAKALAQRLRCRYERWGRRHAGRGRILINCTTVGMEPDAESSPIPVKRLDPETIVLDTVYVPAQTRLLRDALARGCRVVSGIELFIGQAAGQFALWHRQATPIDLMRRILRTPPRA